MGFWILLVALSLRYLNWTVPVAAFLGIQVNAVLNLVKIAMEHGGKMGQHANAFLRSSSSIFPLRFLVMPFNISLHFEHHCNDAVPWYRLMAYHRELELQVPTELRSKIYKKNGAVWKQLAFNEPIS
jgi:fatty acid desaturase